MKTTKKPFYKKWWVLAIAVIIVGGIIGSFNDDNTSSELEATPTNASEQAKQAESSESIFDEISYFKVENGTGGGNRSYTVYTNSTDEDEMIEYARTKMYSFGGFTYVHFYNNKEHTPDISNISQNAPELAFNPEQEKEYRIFVYEKTANETEIVWNADMSENRIINK